MCVFVNVYLHFVKFVSELTFECSENISRFEKNFFKTYHATNVAYHVHF